MPFNIFDKDTQNLVIVSCGPKVGRLLTFETAAEAAEFCRDRAAFGSKCQPRPAVDALDTDWQDRERQRITSGVYKRPPYLALLERDPSHYLHLADKRPGRLAYTRNAENGQQDKQTIISLQGYIELYFPGIEPWQKEMIEAAHAGMALEEDDLKFASTPDEITSVYTNYDSSCSQVAASCMRYEAGNFSGSPEQHPCSVYGAGDLAVAYLTNASGRTIARALCWPEKKVYTRVYAGSDRIHRLLQQRGFVKSGQYYSDGEKGKSLAGARLLRIEHDDYSDVFLAPYVDDLYSARDNGKFLILDANGCHTLRETCGWSAEIEDEDDEGRYTCERCGEGVDEGEGRTVYTSRRGTEQWCERCVDFHAFFCSYTEEHFDDNVESVRMADGDTWSIYAFNDRGGTCERTGEHFPRDELQTVIVNEDGYTELWCESAVDKFAWTCDRTYDSYSCAVEQVTVTTSLHNEQTWGPHAVSYHAFVSDYDDKYYHIDTLVTLVDGRVVSTLHEQEAREGCTALAVVETPKITLKGDDPGQLRFVVDQQGVTHVQLVGPGCDYDTEYRQAA